MEKHCEVCSEKVRSDAALKSFCATCGMGLTGVALVAGRGLRFCGRTCLEVFAARGGLA